MHARSCSPMQRWRRGAMALSKERKKGSKQRVRHGYCRLTGEPGRFVKSHIIPQGLTLGVKEGEPLVQYGAAAGASQRWSSWYDPLLVTRSGEDILADLDTWAISALRSNRLVWGGWGDDSVLEDLYPLDSVFGVREVFLDTGKLRLFFLSLLWRAGASQMREFQEIDPPDSHLEIMKTALLGRGMPGLDFYPIQLTQLSTKGPLHNHAPSRETKYIPNLHAPDEDGFPVPFYRFYFDGLIVHFARPDPKSPAVDQLGKLVVGASSSIVISTVTYEESLQRKSFERLVMDYLREPARGAPPAGDALNADP